MAQKKPRNNARPNKIITYYNMFEQEKQAIIDMPDKMLKLSDFRHLVNEALLANLISTEQYRKYIDVFDNVMPILLDSGVSSRALKLAFQITRATFNGNGLIEYMLKRFANQKGIEL